MKSLQTVQKTFRVFQVLTKIAMFLSFVWVGLAARGLLCAQKIRALGIRTIVLPLVAAILAAVVCAVFDLPLDAGGDWGNLTSVTMGIALILASLVFRYGADLEEKAAGLGEHAAQLEEKAEQL